ncbi:MAG: FKBP-type peptidyl-prolyl cis-trans isomerase [Clostridia bacterium]|nr:FKBP-type peptidyl-prolyl cis-trans isomerase [Clostridia bacterium]
MKRILSLGLAVLVVLTLLVGCSKKNRILYSDFDLLENVTLGEYKGIKVDTSSESFKEIYNTLVNKQVLENNFQAELPVTEGIIENGDIANIDYEGKKNGVAFEGGTATDHDLIIGSNSFIDGFESGLIGKKIGDTVDLDLTFPENYHSEELAGQKVVFTVKINSANKALKPEEFYSKLGYKSLEEFEKSMKHNAVNNYLLSTFLKNCQIKKYSEKDKEFLIEESVTPLENNIKLQYGINLESYLLSLGQTKEAFIKNLVSEQIIPKMESNMPLYALIDKEGITVTGKEVTDRINKIVESYNDPNVTADDLKEYYGEYYFEEMIVKEKAVEFIRENAEIS